MLSFTGCNWASWINGKSGQDLQVQVSNSKITVSNNLQLTVVGGKPPYSYELVSGTGQINSDTGIFVPQSKGTVVVRVTDSVSQSKLVEIEVEDGFQFISSDVDWAHGVGVQFTLDNLITGGIPPYSYSKISGGGTLNSISGNFIQSFGWEDTKIKATDSIGNTSELTMKRRPSIFNGYVNVIKEFVGSLYVGGSFTAVNSYALTQFAQINAITGDLTTTTCNWQKKIVGNVSSFLIDDDHLYIGGYLTKYDNVTVAGLIRINRHTCELDPLFSQAQGFYGGGVTAIANFGDYLFVGGSFDSYRGTSTKGIAKINKVSGVLDSNFSNGSAFAGGSAAVSGLAIEGNSVYAAGWFNTYRGLPSQNLAKLDVINGNLDQAFTLATGLSSSANDILIANNALYVSGQFSQYRGQTAKNVAKIDLVTGVLDVAFNQATGFDGTIFKMQAGLDSLYVLGQFANYRGVAAQRLAKIDLISGDLDLTFTQPTGFLSISYGLKLYENSLYVGGAITTYRGTAVEGLIKIDALTGDLDTTFSQQTGFGNTVSVIEAIPSENKLYVGGSFTTYRGTKAKGLVKINKTTGEIDELFLNNANIGSVSDIVYNAGSIYVAGGPGGITKLDATTGMIDVTYTQTPGFSFNTKSLAIANNALYVGGRMTSYNGTALQSVAKIDLLTGALDTTFTLASGFNHWVEAIASDGTSLYVGGYFSLYRGVAARRLAKIDLTTGALDNTFTQATGFNGEITALLIKDNDIYAGGSFWTYRGTSVAALAKLNKFNGNMDTTFSQATGFPPGFPLYSIVENNGSIYIGGAFYRYRGIDRPALVKIDSTSGDLDQNFSNEVGYDSRVNSVFTDGLHLYTGGLFNYFSNHSANYFLRSNLQTGSPE
jgi:hypothetical protein